MRLCALLAVCVAVGCGKPAEQPTAPTEQPSKPAADLFGTSTFAGKVLFKGDVPKAAAIKMSADPYCQASHGDKVMSEEVLVNDDGTLRNVFVYVKQGVSGRYPAPKDSSEIDQSGCMYRPRVQGMLVGQVLVIRNSDDTLHNIHCLAEKNSAFNLGQPAKGMESKKVFAQPEVMMRFKCDVHPWMSAYIGVLEHPFFAVTGDGGTFTIPKLPAGDYVVETWHEKYDAQQQIVTVANDETKTIEFTFGSPP